MRNQENIGRHHDSPGYSGGTEGCHSDYSGYLQRPKSRHSENPTRRIVYSN